MTLDYSSLLVAVGFSGACLALTLFGSWLTARSERFLLTWSMAVLLIVLNVFAYSLYINTGQAVYAYATYTLLLGGFSLMLGAAHQFRTGKSPIPLFAYIGVISNLIAIPPLVIGYDGLGFMLLNIAACIILLAVAVEYWRGRKEAPGQIIGMVVLYTLTGISFALCAAVLIWDGNLILGSAPKNWAENLNLATAIAGLTGIGAISLTLNHSRMARVHQQDAQTDQLTGLFNRRALFELFGKSNPGPLTAVIMFDLDNFKAVNDEYGHAAGDEVLRIFASELIANKRSTDVAARLGGEEFALVLTQILPDRAESTAERIRAAFSRRQIMTDNGMLSCTVSAGVGFSGQEDISFERLLIDADKALYGAKRDGRNRVSGSTYLRVV
jgi:diguanylate cyclase (GGDEF)-like protein